MKILRKLAGYVRSVFQRKSKGNDGAGQSKSKFKYMQVYTMRKSGMSAREVSSRLGISDANVRVAYRYARVRAGEPPLRFQEKPGALAAKVIRLANNSTTVRQLADKIGVSSRDVRGVIYRHRAKGYKIPFLRVNKGWEDRDVRVPRAAAKHT